MASTPGDKKLSRRKFLTQTGSLAFGFAFGTPLLAEAALLKPRTLSFYHIHTDQRLDIEYAYGRVYDADALNQIDYFLRDFRTGDVHTIDSSLLDLLWSVQHRLSRRGWFEVISGYRSPTTNKLLRSRTTGVAKKSLHMRGKAIDVRLPGVATTSLRRCAISFKRGGVGYYPKSDFVHLDTGRFRTW
nr:DUF882 domain-containing protein [Desulfogranum japonicum]